MVKRENYEAASRPHRARGKQIRSLIKQVLRDEQLKVHSVTHRIKTEGSATAKLDASPTKYGSFGDLHDLLGLRVVTHLATEVAAVAAVLRREFDVDDERSIDKLEALDADEFGYRSVHLIVKLRDERAALPEWRIIAGIYFEIQVRSILQHAWAEIEHDLGYKPSSGVPQEIQRRFARLAGILELADDEFDRLTDDARAHARKTDAAVKSGANVPIDRDSIISLIASADSIRSADAQIAYDLDLVLLTEVSPDYANLRAKELREVGLESNLDVDQEMRLLGDRVARFATAWLAWSTPSSDGDDEFMFMGPNEADDDEERTISPGVSLFYLFLHRLIEEQGEEFDSVPADPEDFDDEDAIYSGARRTEFLRLHEEIFATGSQGDQSLSPTD